MGILSKIKTEKCFKECLDKHFDNNLIITVSKNGYIDFSDDSQMFPVCNLGDLSTSIIQYLFDRKHRFGYDFSINEILVLETIIKYFK